MAIHVITTFVLFIYVEIPYDLGGDLEDIVVEY